MSLDDGDRLALRVDDALPGSDPSDADVVRYSVSFQAAQGWLPLCGLDSAGKPVRAIPLAGRWDLRQGVPGGGAWLDDPDGFTFACEGYVLAKCVDMGYAPWREGRSCLAGTRGKGDCTQKISLAPYHHACARMLRADYCGDGTSHTQDGTALNAYDALGVRFDSEDWAAESEWTEAGASCLARLRDPSAAAPACADRLLDARCGQPGSVAASTLLVSEIVP
ncbi:MAG: ADYC domain-containing protein [Myxococcales bacterium]